MQVEHERVVSENYYMISLEQTGVVVKYYKQTSIADSLIFASLQIFHELQNDMHMYLYIVIKISYIE